MAGRRGRSRSGPMDGYGALKVPVSPGRHATGQVSRALGGYRECRKRIITYLATPVPVNCFGVVADGN